MKQSLDRRIEILEHTPAARLARALESGDFSEITDAELNALIAEIEADIGPEETARIHAMSAEELAAFANGADIA